MRDVSNISHCGNGDTEAIIKNVEDEEALKGWLMNLILTVKQLNLSANPIKHWTNNNSENHRL